MCWQKWLAIVGMKINCLAFNKGGFVPAHFKGSISKLVCGSALEQGK